MRWFMSIKHYFLDTDVIFNFSMTLVRAEINIENFNIKDRKIITTKVISIETEKLFDNVKNKKNQRHRNITDNQLELYIKTWKNIKKNIHIFNHDKTYAISKNIGEKSLISEFNNYNKTKKFIVSNNKKDIIKFSQNISENKILTPFEFYEDVLKKMGIKYRNILHFMIISNEDLRVINLISLGDIVNKYNFKV